MIIIKRYFFQHNSSVTTPNDVIFVDTIEKLDDGNYPIFTWPCSVLLSAYLFHQKHTQNPAVILDHTTSIIELGSGTALPSLLCSKLGVRHCYITERSDQPDMLQHIEESIDLNKVQTNSTVVPLTWGYHAYERFEDIPTVDLILGADIFYSDEDFDSILFNVFQLMVKNPRAIFLSSYQQRE
jgi:predicted nicotinamide N-methyase